MPWCMNQEDTTMGQSGSRLNTNPSHIRRVRFSFDTGESAGGRRRDSDFEIPPPISDLDVGHRFVLIALNITCQNEITLN